MNADLPIAKARRTFRSQIDAHRRAQWIINGVLVLLLALLYSVGYRPAAQRSAALADELGARRAELAAAMGLARDLKVREADVDRLRARLDRLDQLLPSLRDYAQEYGAFTRQITQLAQQSAIQKVNWIPSPVRRAGALAEQPVSLSFEGDFVNVYSFLRQAEVMQRLARVRKLSLRSVDAKRGQVEVQLAMTLYFSDNP